MDKARKLKLIGYVVLIILIANMILFGMRIIDGLVFWGIILIGFLFVWKGLPWIRERV